MILAAVCWLAIALIVGLVCGMLHEDRFLVDFRHGFRQVIAFPFLAVAIVGYFIYTCSAAVAEFIEGDQ